MKLEANRPSLDRPTIGLVLPSHGVPQGVFSQRLAVVGRESSNRTSISLEHPDPQRAAAGIGVDHLHRQFTGEAVGDP